MGSPTRIVLAWAAAAVAAVAAFFAMVWIALTCFDCAEPPSTWLVVAPWVLPAGLVGYALRVSRFHGWIVLVAGAVLVIAVAWLVTTAL